MTSPLQKAPIGLLGAFDLKTLGQNPNRFGDTVLPSVDVHDYYLLQQLEIETAQLVITNPASNGFLTFDVPIGEIWILRGWGANATLNAADTATGNSWLVVSLNDQANQIVVGADELRAPSLPTYLRAAGRLLERPVMLRGGWGILLDVQMGAAPTVNATFTLSVLIQRIRE